MALTLWINGTQRSIKTGTLDVQETLNGRASMRVGVRSTDGSYIPTIDHEVELREGASTVVFKGIIVDVLVTYLAMGAGLVSTIDVSDYNHYPERRVVRASTGGGISGRDAIDYLVANFLAVYGVTRDPAMPSGATLGALAYDYARVNEVLDDIVRLAAPTGWVWRINENKVLTAFVPGAAAWPCPFTVADGASNIVGDITIRRPREQYANRVFLTYGDGTAVPATVVQDNTSEQASRGIYEMALSTPGPLDQATATEICQGYLTQLSATPTQVEFVTREAGAHAGQTISIVLTNRSLSGNYLITDVRAYDVGGVAFYQITAISGSVPVQTWRETYRLWADRSTPRGGVGWGTYTSGLVLFFEDGESGSSLATLGFVDFSGTTTNLGAANTSGQGLNGTTYGILASNSYPEVGHNVPSPGYGERRDGWVEFYTDFSDPQEFGWTLVAATNGNYSSATAPIFDLYIGTDSGTNKFWLYTGYDYPSAVAELSDAFQSDTETLVKVAWRQSTYTGGAPNADGEVRVYLNGSQVWAVTGIHVADGSSTEPYEVTRIYTNPCGRIDEIRFGYGVVNLATPTGAVPSDTLVMAGYAPTLVIV